MAGGRAGMDQLRQILDTIGRQLRLLSVTQKLLIASLCILLVMTLFLVSQYAGSPKTVALLPSGTPEDQQKVAEFLANRNMAHTVDASGRVMVAVDQRYVALGAMAREQALPGDKRVMFDSLISQQNIWMSKQQLDQQYTITLQNELSAIIRSFPGVESASVVISAPEPKGINSSFRKPVAQVTVFPRRGMPLDQATVNALADLVSGSVAGLDMRDVAIIDGTNRRSHRAVGPEDLAAGTYLEHAAKVEQRVQEKVENHLRFMGGVIVSVNAMVDAAKREIDSRTFLDKGQGTVSLPAEETSSNSTSSNTTRAAEPGLGSNVTMDINRGGGASGTSTSDESTSVKSEVRIGERRVLQRDASGRPTKINVTVSVPRDYVAQIVRQRKAAAGGGGGGADASAEPSEDEIRQEWEGQGGVKAKIEEMIGPLVETEAPSAASALGGPGQITAGAVRAFLIPVAVAALPGAPAEAGGLMGGGAGSTLSGLLGGGLVRTVALGALAAASLGMMLMMVRKAGKQPALPTAEELVGIPPALQPGSDVVGEADETDTAMTGIEIDDESLKANKMLEEVATLVKNNPSQASQVFNRWVNAEQ
jgi:flagellar biosynthesis/type III secretory pathway M-ring protein FliF/YscJ